MSASQSPTQSNNGRSYEHYFQTSASNLLDDADVSDEVLQEPTQSTSHGLRTLQDGDTGAVIFESPLQSDDDIGSLKTTGFALQETSQQEFSHTFELFPKTPAPGNHNPFGQRKASQLLPPSQLFARTHSAKRRNDLSPTSSRPSPDVFQANDISPNPGASSPLKARGLPSSMPHDPPWSPGLMPASRSSHAPFTAMTPQRTDSTKSVLGSSQHSVPQSPVEPQLTSEYEPMGISQERRTSVLARQSSDILEDDSEEDSYDKKRRANLKRAAARNKLQDISVPASSRLNRAEISPKEKKSTIKAQEEGYLQQCHRKAKEEESDGETVADSQENLLQLSKQRAEAKEPTQSDIDEEVLPSTAPLVVNMSPRQLSPDLANDARNDSSYPDAIPETSPTRRRPENISSGNKSSGGAPVIPATSSNDLQTRRRLDSKSPLHQPLSAPQLSEPQPSEPQSEVKNSTDVTEDSVTRLPCVAGIQGVDVGSRINVPLQEVMASSNFSSSPPALSTRARRRLTKAQKLPTSSAPPTPAALSSTSSLSPLATLTPELTSSTTPDTRESPPPEDGNTRQAESSPAVSKNRRRSAQEHLPKLQTKPSGDLRHSARLVRHPSVSTDELARSPASEGSFQQSRQPRVAATRHARTASRAQSLSRDAAPRKLFENMAFAVSFQGKKPGETVDGHRDRMSTSTITETKIREAGGKVLTNGFDELFEAHPVKSAAISPASLSQEEPEIRLAPAARSIGFAALIADGHSRKVKYMQALALGLPCIASRWITSCVEKGELIDWTPYLLCAGQSTFLGDAIRSRNLSPYDAAEAKLTDTIAQRPRMLNGNHILLIMKKADESKKMAYVFLARVLGASLSRVYSIEEARTKLKAAEDLEQPFDWVYVDDKIEAGGLFASAAVALGDQGKKRKRRGSPLVDSGPPPKKIRTLSDELVIQSLILGRMIEEGEMDE